MFGWQQYAKMANDNNRTKPANPCVGMRDFFHVMPTLGTPSTAPAPMASSGGSSSSSDNDIFDTLCCTDDAS